MSAPRFEVVQTESGFHARSIAANGEAVLWSEVYPDRRDALNAIRVSAQLFSITPVFFDEKDGVVYVHAAGMRVEVRNVESEALEPCGQCRAPRDTPCREGCDEMLDGRSIV